MRRVNSSELLSMAASVVMAMSIVITTVLVGGCGGSQGPPAQAVTPMSLQGQPGAVGEVVSPASASGPGDMDGDGLPTVGDAIKILRFVVGLDVPTSTERWFADANGGGDVDVGDAIMVLRAVVGLEGWPLPWPGGGGPPPPPF